jgi:hypothetical protein
MVKPITVCIMKIVLDFHGFCKYKNSPVFYPGRPYLRKSKKTQLIDIM